MDDKDQHLQRVRKWADETLAYLASAYWKEKAREVDHSSSVRQAMVPAAHVLALLDGPLEQTDRQVMRMRAKIMDAYLADAREGRIDWSPEGGIVDRR
jgi:hypothetical protein